MRVVVVEWVENELLVGCGALLEDVIWAMAESLIEVLVRS